MVISELVCNLQTDKASLLAEVVHHVKHLRKQAADMELCDRELMWLFPGESDEATLSYCEAGFVKATLCCEDRPGLNGDLMQAIRSVRARTVRAEMSTLGGRTKNVVELEWSSGGGEDEVRTLKRALKAVVENRASGSGLGQMVSGNALGFMDRLARVRKN